MHSTLLLILFLIIAFVVHSAYSIWSFSKVNELKKSDAAIILGAAVWNDETSPVFQERINHGIWLYKNGYVTKLIFTGGKSGEDSYAESEVARDYAIAKNVSEEDILIETKSNITEENLYHANVVASKNSLKTFIIVSDPLHMKRAMLIADTIGLQSYASPTPTTLYRSLESKVPFFFRELFFYIGYLFTLPIRML
ncbi:YdcF family protein [Cytobacillus suaedae]|nr:YdcF family protein [Cytobacillus suaedae]